MIELVGFDGDDTLWHSEGYYRAANDEFERILYRRVLAEFDVPAERFAMVGNSLRSDIQPVLELGGWGVHMPYHVTWAHELETTLDAEHSRFVTVGSAAAIPAALATLDSGEV